MSLIFYKVKDRKYTEVKDRKFTSIRDLKLDNDEIYIIIDKHMKRPKIWIWSGSNSNMRDKYFAGVSATTIKSRKKLYGATIEVVESGNEPDQFPIPKKEKLIEQTMEDIGGIGDEQLTNTTELQIKSSIEDSQPKPLKTAPKEDLINQQKVISLLQVISHDLEQIQKKINIFLMDYKKTQQT